MSQASMVTEKQLTMSELVKMVSDAQHHHYQRRQKLLEDFQRQVGDLETNFRLSMGDLYREAVAAELIESGDPLPGFGPPQPIKR